MQLRASHLLVLAAAIGAETSLAFIGLAHSQGVAGKVHDGGAAETVAAMVARSEAIFSGRIAYKYVYSFSKEEAEECSFSFCANDWVMRYRGGGIGMTRKGKSLEYYFAEQKDGSVRRNAIINSPKTTSDFQLVVPTRAGTIWNECTKEFMTKYADKARFTKSVELDGVTAKVLEWDVTAERVFEAFQAVDDIAFEGGVLRVCTVPDYGYAIPLIEHLGKDRRPQTIFSAEGFKLVAPGVYFPTRYVMQDYLSSGKGVRKEFHMQKVELINQQLPEPDFIAVLPIGTHITDLRTKDMKAFDLVPDSPYIDRVSDIIAVDVPVAASKWPWKYITGTALVFILVATFFIKRRKPRPSAE